MSFLSKNWAGLLACLIISIISWVLGGFLPVVGAPVFAIFIGMILHPFLTSYTQLDAGLTYTVLTEGYRTGDIMSEGCTRVGTCKMGDLIAERIG